MSLRDVLLSLLREPMSGSDLVPLFRSTIGHFWNADLSQIYRALADLQEEGCIESTTVPSPRGPARKVYRLTHEGRQRLQSWIRQPAATPPIKFEYLAQLFSVTADENPRQRALDLFHSMRNDAEQQLRVLEAIDTEFREIPGYPHEVPGHLFYPWLTLRHGLLRRRAMLEWIDECIRYVESRSPQSDEGIGDQAVTKLVQMLHLSGEPREERSDA